MKDDDRDPEEFAAGEETAPRSEVRQFFALIIISMATAMALGMTLRLPTHLGANDISRWCTVWSLLERGNYVIDECPWVSQTQDKVKKASKLADPGPNAGLLSRFEYAIAPQEWKTGEPVDHFYSSKPPLLPTMIAGLLYPIRQATGIPLDKVVEQERLERYVEKPVEGEPGKTTFILETPKEPAHWPVYVLYLKPIVILLNVVPMLIVLVLYARFLDRTAETDWAWMLSLATGAFGTYLLVFIPSLNNHSIAASSAFLAIYAFQRIWADRRQSAWWFIVAGLFSAFTVCNELPAAVFGVLLVLPLFVRYPGKTLKFFVPAAVIPIAAFLVTQYLAFGQFKPVYEEFGTKSYNYEGSYWNTPLEFDWFNASTPGPDGTSIPNQEPYEVYLFHMTLGHHGVFSLTPIFLFALLGAGIQIVKRDKLSALAWLTLILTVAMLAFYTWNPKARNYGGSTQGLRWLFWLIPFWLAVLPAGLNGGQRNRFVRGLTLGALAISALSVGYAARNPWSHPWLLDGLEHLNLYHLNR